MFIRTKGFNSSRHRGGQRFGTGNFRSGGFSRPRNNYGSQNFSDITKFVNKASETSVEENYVPTNSFTDFNICEPLKDNIKNRGYIKPTPIQDQAIQHILDGRDLIGLAATGTGKTAAFLIPLIDKLYKVRDEKAIIIAPTRELALQIQEEFRGLTQNMKLYSTSVIGGANMNRQISEIRRRPHVIIATPGRLKDLIQRHVVYLEDYSTFILDEVDLMVDIGFIQDIKYFIGMLPPIRQSLFFSATIGRKVEEILYAFVNDPITVSLKKQDTSENVDQDIVRVVDRTKKVDHLHDLLIKDGFDKVLIFGRTKHGIEKLNDELINRGFKTGSIHGNKSQGQRQRVLDSFKRNQIQVLLATDLASRGLDIDNVTHVINYDLPQTYDDYIHRIGRTGRADKKGIALTFVE
jgi:superfamily II DNA/RNA helicase